MLSSEAMNTINFIVFSLTLSEIETQNNRTRGEHSC
jgi:hypothetical protein